MTPAQHGQSGFQFSLGKTLAAKEEFQKSRFQVRVEELKKQLLEKQVEQPNQQIDVSPLVFNTLTSAEPEQAGHDDHIILNNIP
jgi:hypothetical protein